MRSLLASFALLFSLLAISVSAPTPAYACPCACQPNVKPSCAKESQTQSVNTIKHITDEFIKHREWMVKEFWEAKLLPGLMLMTEQLTVAGMQQVQIIGTFFDAKHQLETQRLFQELTAQAHKDYHPSEGLCTFGTNMRSLAASDRNVEFTAQVLSERALARQTLQSDTVAGPLGADAASRFNQFMTTYCDPKDNAGTLEGLCGTGGKDARRNKDINFTATLSVPTTLQMDMTVGATGDRNRDDAQDILALAANLYGHKPLPIVPRATLNFEDDAPSGGLRVYQDARALVAKRIVAHNSFAAQAAQKAMGEKEVAPYLTALLKEMGIPEKDIEEMLGERPSYDAQMKVLTQKLFQNPNFYTDLYDKPANVRRKAVAIQAINLMQKRDTFRTLLRTEANLSMLLEMEVANEQRRLANEINPAGN